MKFTTTTTTLLTASVASAAVLKRQSQGDGPYGPVSFTTDETLTRHTIYAPATGPTEPMPVLVWGNGACSDDGTSAQNMLAQVASHGFVAIASGPPGGAGGSTTAEWMSEAIEWVVGGANGLNVDSSRIMAAGYSCGGTEAYEMEGNAAVKALGIFNSGLLGGYELAGQLTKPTLYALGGPDDIAYENGERDYAALPADLPAWKGNLNSVGHGGTYGEANGGLFATAAVNWMLWLFNGDAEAGAYFGEGAAVAAGWSDAVGQNIDGFSVPIGGGAAVEGGAPADAPTAGNGTVVEGGAPEEAPTTGEDATTGVEAPVEGGATDGSLTVEDGAIDGSVDAGIAAAPVDGGAATEAEAPVTGWSFV